MEVIAVIAVVIAAAALGVAAAYRREFRRMAAFLSRRERSSNGRLAVALPDAAARELVQAVNGELDAIAAERRQAAWVQKEFREGLASLSHDIRTPLAGAKGYGQLASAEEDADRRTEQLRRLQQRLNAMEFMLDGLFAYTQTLDGAGPGGREPIDCQGLLAEVLLGQYPLFEERGWQPDLAFDSEELVVYSDREALTRIFENIVANCLRHGADGPAVRGSGPVIAIANGMREGEPIEADRVFDRFYRGDPSRSSEGAGLGLAVVANLCDTLDIGVGAQVQQGMFAIEFDFSRVLAGESLRQGRPAAEGMDIE